MFLVMDVSFDLSLMELKLDVCEHGDRRSRESPFDLSLMELKRARGCLPFLQPLCTFDLSLMELKPGPRTPARRRMARHFDLSLMELKLERDAGDVAADEEALIFP